MTLPNASDQFAAVLAAPLPFFFALAAVVLPLAAAIWYIMEWAYRRRIDLLETMHSHAVAENNRVRARLSDTQAAVESQESVIAKLKEKRDAYPDLVPTFDELFSATATTGTQIDRLAAANDALSDTLLVYPYEDETDD